MGTFIFHACTESVLLMQDFWIVTETNKILALTTIF